MLTPFIQVSVDQCGRDFRHPGLALGHHRLAQIVAMSARKHQQARIGKQPRERDGVLHPHDVAIAQDDQGGGADRADAVVGDVLERLHPPGVLVVHATELRRIGVHPEEGVLERLRHAGEIGVLHEVPEPGRGPVAPGERRREDQLPHQPGMPARHLERHAGAVAEAEEVRLGDAEVPEQRRDVVGRSVEANRRVAVGGAAVALFLDGDDATSPGQERDYPAEGDVDGRTAAVEQDQRNAAGGAVGLVVHRDAVHGGVAAVRQRGAERQGIRRRLR
jgi:hypothetical protein